MRFSEKVLAKYDVDYWKSATMFPFTQQGQRPPVNLNPDSDAVENDEKVIPTSEESSSTNDDLDLSNYSKALKWALENIPDLEFEHEDEDDDYTKAHKDSVRQQIDDRVGQYVDKFNEVNKKPHIEVYRAICVKKKQDLDFKKLGTWWSFEENGVGCYGADTRGKVQVVVTALVQPKDIDWETGFYSFVLYGEDQWECSINQHAEITVTHIDGEKVSKPFKAKA